MILCFILQLGNTCRNFCPFYQTLTLRCIFTSAVGDEDAAASHPLRAKKFFPKLIRFGQS